MQSRTNDAGHPLSVHGYELVDRIGTGGFSVVYRARQASMNREVAVKVLNLGFATAEEQRTFERECHALGRLSHHPNIVTVFNETTSSDGRPCLVMELYRSTFRQRVEHEGPLPITTALTVGVKVAGALQAAHDAGILHRDLKPHNIFLSAYGEPALGDFGISTIEDERSHSGASGLSVAYAAPEILEEGRATVAADVYSLAATIYQLVAGEAPFASAQLKTAVRRILTEEPPPIDRPDVPPALDRILRRALSKDPAQRPPSALAFAESLREIQARLGVEPTPIPTLAADDGHAAEPSSQRASAGASSVAPAEAPAPTPQAPRPTPATVEHDPDSGVTIARARTATPPAHDDVETPEGGSPTRRWIAGGLAVVAVAVVGVGVILGGGGGDDAPAATTVAAPLGGPDINLVNAPTDVSVDATDGGFEVAYSVADNVTSVEIILRSGPESGKIIVSSSPPMFIETSAPTLCVELRSLGDGGRISNPTGPFCS